MGGPSPLWIDHTTHPGDFKAFLSSGSKVQIEFGAKHCAWRCCDGMWAEADPVFFLSGIIVRNDEARQRLRKELGNSALVPSPP